MRIKLVGRPLVCALAVVLAACSTLGVATDVSERGVSAKTCECGHDQPWHPIPLYQLPPPPANRCGSASCGTGSCGCIAESPDLHHPQVVLPQREESQTLACELIACPTISDEAIISPSLVTRITPMDREDFHDAILTSDPGPRAPPA